MPDATYHRPSPRQIASSCTDDYHSRLRLPAASECPVTMNEWSEAELHVERAHEAYEAGRWEEAAKALRDALALNPYRPDWHFNLGLTLEQAGRYEEAAKAFAQYDALEKDDPQVLLAAGVNLLRADQPAEAMKWLERAERADPTSSAPWVHRIEAYARMGEHEQAELMFYMAQQVNAKDAGAFANMAESLALRGLHEKAAWCLKEAAELEPNLPKVHARLADAYAHIGRLERARLLYLRELRNDPGDIDTILDLGALLVEMGRISDAADKFRRVLEIEPDNVHAVYAMADLSVRQGLVDVAIDGFETVLKLDATFPGARRQLAACLLARGAGKATGSTKGGGAGAGSTTDREVAIDHLQGEYQAFLDHPERVYEDELLALGRVLHEAGLSRQACRVLRRLVMLRPEHSAGYQALSLASFQAHERQDGLRAGRRVVKLDPLNTSTMYNMAVAHALDRQWGRARYWLARAIKIDPSDADIRRLRVKLWLYRLADGLCGGRVK